MVYRLQRTVVLLSRHDNALFLKQTLLNSIYYCTCSSAYRLQHSCLLAIAHAAVAAAPAVAGGAATAAIVSAGGRGRRGTAAASAAPLLLIATSFERFSFLSFFNFLLPTPITTIIVAAAFAILW